MVSIQSIIQNCFGLFGLYLFFRNKTNHLGAMDEGWLMDHKAASQPSFQLSEDIYTKTSTKLNHEFEIYLSRNFKNVLTTSSLVRSQLVSVDFSLT